MGNIQHIIPMDTEQKFLETVEAFLARHKMSASKFGRLSVNDSALVWGLREGRSPSLKTCKRITDWMADYESKKNSKKPRLRGLSNQKRDQGKCTGAASI